MLVNTITEIQEFIAIGSDSDFDRLKPHLVSVESTFIKPILGDSFLKELQTAYDALINVSSSAPEPTEDLITLLDAQAKVIWAVKRALVYLSYWSGFQVLNTTISDSGFKRTESANVKSQFKYQEDDLRNHFKTNGFDALDQMLQIIEENISSFADFKKSANWTILKANLIPDTKTLNAIIYINNSRLTFLRLIPSFKLVEDIYIRPLLGSTLFDRIKAEMIKAEPDQKIISVLPFIQKPLAFLATALLMEESGADISEKGLYFESYSAVSQNDRNFNPADKERISLLTKRNRQYAENYLEELKSFLKANSSTFSDFTGSSGNIYRRNNNDKKSFWA